VPDQPQDIELQNSEVQAWFTDTLRAVKARYTQLIHNPGRGSISGSTHSSYGEIDRVSFRFKRYLIYVHKGAGRGQGGSKGSQWTDPHGNKRSTNPLSFGKMNTGRRHAEEWLNPVLDTEVPKLADIVANCQANAVVKAIRIK
jgi:hypothetical protein